MKRSNTKRKGSKKKSNKFSLLKLSRYSGAAGGVTGVATLLNNLWMEKPWWKKEADAAQLAQSPPPAPPPPPQAMMSPGNDMASVMSVGPDSSFYVMSESPDFPWYIDILNYMLYSPVQFWAIAISVLLVLTWLGFELKNKYFSNSNP